jgi:hypothetical protein
VPLINIIRGEAIPTAPFTVRTPVLRLPVWLLVLWQAIKALDWLFFAYIRFWYLTLPTTALIGLYAEFGWQGRRAQGPHGRAMGRAGGPGNAVLA